MEATTVGLRLSLGCGAALLPPPWRNLDYAKQSIPKGYHFQLYDLRDGLPYPDNSVDLIHCAHALDHVSFYDAVALLKECKRVMCPMSVGRFIMMDFDAIWNAYQDRQVNTFAKWQPPEWGRLRSNALKLSLFLMGSMSGQREYTGHWWVTDFGGFREMASMAGFSDVKRMEYGKSQSRVIEIEVPEAYPDHSLYVEVVR